MVKTLFLSNADLKETIDLLRVVLGARRVAPLPGGNALTINDTPDKVAAAERIVEIVDKRRAEVVVEVEHPRGEPRPLKDYGIQITSGLDAQGIEGVAWAIFPDPTHHDPSDNPYDRDNLVVTRLPGASTACSRPTPPPASWPTRSCAPPRARPRRPASATRCRCRSPPSPPSRRAASPSSPSPPSSTRTWA